MSGLVLRVPPAPGEAWHGYLSRAAAEHGADAATLAGQIGLRQNGYWPGYHGVLLEPDMVARCAEALHLAPEQVTAMQLSSLDGTACDLTGLDDPGLGRLQGTRRASHNAWVFLAGGRYCPECLRQDGVWKLEWKIPWVTTCTAHRAWLEHACPVCGGTIGRYSTLNAAAPSRARTRIGSQFCDLPRGDGACGADLSTTPARPASDAARQATEIFEDLVGSGWGGFAGTSHRSLLVLRAWQSTIGLSIALRRSTVPTAPRHHRWASPPRDARLFDQLVQDAAPLATASSETEASQELLAWCRDAGINSPHRGTFGRATQSAPALEPVLTAALASVGRAHIRLERRRRDSIRPLPLLGWGPEDVPQLVWPCALPLHRRGNRRPDHRILRAVVALVLVRMHDGRTWSSAGSVLGIPPLNATNWTRYCFSQRFAGLKEELLQTADRLSLLLPLQPRRGAWTLRPDIPPGDGRTSLKAAQSPACRLQDPKSRWCPCRESNR